MKSGYMDGNTITDADVKKLADLETREVLLAKTAGAIKASLFKAAYTFNALPSKAVRVVDALRQKQESN
jgi:large subunit ribosomal protein L10